MAPPKFHNLKIKSLRRQTENAVAIGFDVPASQRSEFSFEPGQYLTLRATVGGEDIRRSYSICSACDDEILEVGIKRVEGGKFSSYAQNLKIGDTVQVMPPQGRFSAPLGGLHRYLLLATGSGITPCLSIAKSVLEAEIESQITLVYGNKTISSVMFLDDLIALKDRYTDRFQIFHTLSREQSDVDFLNGRLDGSKLHALTDHKLVDLDTFDAAYICGPQLMAEDLAETLKELGMVEEAIKTELFLTAGQPTFIPPAKTANMNKGSEVSIILDGTQKTVQVDGAQTTVLAAAQQAGLDLPFSCAGGMCCTCRCKIISGEAVMDVNYSLQDWEVDAGFTLACQSRPTSKSLTLDFDAS